LDLPFRIALAVIFVAFVAHRAYYTRKFPPSADDTIDEKKGGAASAVAGILAMVGLASLLIYLFFPGLLAWASLPFPDWLRWCGVIVALLGFGLLQWSQQTLGHSWSDTPRITGRQELVTGGPYRWMRHPIYTAFLLILGSPLLISANWLLGGAWIGMAAIDIASRIRYEEEKMLARFGDEYQAYMQRTGRLLPPF
jgi:protein-S-isoprenylcysteine O-methyltransferase Ste14